MPKKFQITFQLLFGSQPQLRILSLHFCFRQLKRFLLRSNVIIYTVLIIYNSLLSHFFLNNQARALEICSEKSKLWFNQISNTVEEWNDARNALVENFWDGIKFEFKIFSLSKQHYSDSFDLMEYLTSLIKPRKFSLLAILSLNEWHINFSKLICFEVSTVFSLNSKVHYWAMAKSFQSLLCDYSCPS